MNDVKKWLVDYIAANCGRTTAEIMENLDENYFLAGYIDSFQFINMVADIEEKFAIEFANEQFEDRSFSTVNGLARIIEGLIK